MKRTLKPIGEQTIVISGATSGIGPVAARKPAKKGAKRVLAARNETALEALCEEIRQHGGLAVAAATDVSRYEATPRRSRAIAS
ncbi:hypothetical protein WS71_11725 [Burkholderia mayonis]|uniref:Short-chain dehydrogenase n=1 Tax=Burkholderia mayonis TaxID=1385591 RepID=A0A1B4FW29_9BURK|nr:hypothetical protein WS71_11725 [Burkholderia mayonis]KVE55401.1 hypothetical protein WS71_02820 [Burkholderia mayonis]